MLYGSRIRERCNAILVIGAAIIVVLPRCFERIEGCRSFRYCRRTMGMLGTAAYILAMDTFGPITDNAWYRRNVTAA